MDALLNACTAGDLAAVTTSLASGTPAHSQRDSDGASALMLAAGGGHAEIVQALLRAGAPWNALDRCDRCAGNYALDASHQSIVDALVEHAVRAELLLAAVEDEGLPAAAAAPPNHEYLSRAVRYEGDKLLDTADDAVMMEWERPLMEAHAERLCATKGDVLNVGFGMGIVDGAIAARAPRSHVIIEAHPEVLERHLLTLSPYCAFIARTSSSYRCCRALTFPEPAPEARRGPAGRRAAVTPAPCFGFLREGSRSQSN